MLASLDKEKGTLTLVSFMRDARVKRIAAAVASRFIISSTAHTAAVTAAAARAS